MATGVGWKGRSNHTSVALPDGSIVLMGGSYIYNYNEYTLSDVWRSTDQGATWTQMTSSVPYHNHSSVALPDGSIVLALFNHLNVWRLETAGSTEQHPTHTYTEPGTYSVALQVYNATGFSSLRRVAYINVTTAEPEAPAITSAGSAIFIIGEDNTFTVTATGIPTPAIQRSGTLPSGVTFTDNGNGTATLAGIPMVGSASVYNLTITASNGVLPNATQNFTLTVLDEALSEFIYLPLVLRQ